jgi:hypothetical protein
MKKIPSIILLFVLITIGTGCKKALEVVPKDEFSPSTVLTNAAGLKALLYSSYSNIQSQPNYRFSINFGEVCTDIAFNTGGNENLIYTQFINFSWDPSVGEFAGVCWNPFYRAIRDADLVLENIDNASDASEQLKKQYIAEARFLRAYAYTQLYNYFGPVPLRTSSEEEVALPRATDAEIRTFIEAELRASLTDLPEPGKEEVFGRATKGTALAVLCKFLLNTREWQKTADIAKQLIDMNYYQLFPVFKDLFKVENEKNKEMIWVVPCTNSKVNMGNWFPSGAMPLGFQYTDQLPEYRWTSSIQNFATKYKLRDAFVNTFDPLDKRFVLVIRKYVNNSNQVVDLTKTPNSTCSLKYFDNNGLKNESGNDIPLLRYADILLARAEALNELSASPTAEAFTLINQVRKRAGIPDLSIVNTPTKDSFRDAILRERAWEFVSEGKRREDLIRHDKFISGAIARGANAKPTHVLFPIPQSEVDANSNMKQNPGY